ncbi:hypothetical protein [Providencia hangzhouensis]|uniref:hypothetical protein n=1 Tax=Providencia hangzhouensis TaxID=3031799 RepID=UPI0034DD27CE
MGWRCTRIRQSGVCGQCSNLIVLAKNFYSPVTGQWCIYGHKVLAIAASGISGAEKEIISALESDLKYDTPFTKISSFHCIAVIGRNNAYLIFKDEGEETVTICRQREPHAIGSGGLIAQTAMKCGEDAIGAVQVAIELDVYSGGKIQEFSIRKAVR